MDGIQPSANWMSNYVTQRRRILRNMCFVNCEFTICLKKRIRFLDCYMVEYRAISFCVWLTGVRPCNHPNTSTPTLYCMVKYDMHQPRKKKYSEKTKNNTKSIQIGCTVDRISYLSCWTITGANSHFVNKANVRAFMNIMTRISPMAVCDNPSYLNKLGRHWSR